MGLLSMLEQSPTFPPLERACERSERVRISYRGPDGRVISGYARVLEIGEEHLLMQWPGVGFGPIAGVAARVECYFEIDGLSYVFDTISRGRVTRQDVRLGALPVMQLDLPERVEQRQQRARYRVSLHKGTPIIAGAHDLETDAPFGEMRLANLSAGGVLTLSDDRAARNIPMGALFWLTFSLPGDPRPFGFVARLVHRNELNNGSGGAALGWAFAPADDAALHAENIRRIERFVAGKQREQLRRAR